MGSGRLRRSRRAAERGVAAVELAILLPVLMLITIGAIDVGDAFTRKANASAALRAASVRAFDAGQDRDHDRLMLRSLVAELNNRNIEGLELVVVWNAALSREVPASCLTTGAIASGGRSGQCVVYDGSDLNAIVTGADADRFDDPDCSLDADKMWCPPDRVQPDGWWVGIYFESSEPTLTGSLPFFDRIEMHESIVFVEWEHPE